ncbi:hypothetical protein OE88DRAFT_156408 [Heliocybe sulcata]|uniref:Secreted protein n=1 Tax=Heliocybe sulcata TaxID=5364 RepID=A0A5C3NIT0_9AGAM|nr:hypothetical protein OE88DRAFT_156408 [Heliocybe sulcata]
MLRCSASILKGTRPVLLWLRVLDGFAMAATRTRSRSQFHGSSPRPGVARVLRTSTQDHLRPRRKRYLCHLPRLILSTSCSWRAYNVDSIAQAFRVRHDVQ